MTTDLESFRPPPGGWTTDHLDLLPEDGHRRELLDGVLLMSLRGRTHQSIAALLMVALDEDCPDGYDVTQGVEVRINRTRSFIPDVLVTTATAAAREPSRYEPHEVVLAVEIVSPAPGPSTASSSRRSTPRPGFRSTGGSRSRTRTSSSTPTRSIRCTRSTRRPGGGRSSSTPASRSR
ncbi:Uma2 family endonuclease [Micromonospora sp. NPDC049033]|uniref:Uma2 family endonuclease n=1 Tax=Micromonospora sp. NPDC049033 TaxID=3155149 RepID=UPI0033E07B77